MYYQIAELILESRIDLPSFAVYQCEPAAADVKVGRTKKCPPTGKETRSGNIIHRELPDGWYCYSAGNENEGLFISKDYTVLRYRGGRSASAARRAERFIRIALECLLIRRGYVSIHAAAVELEGEAIAFTGPSGIGKSTRAQNWTNTFGARLISGDRPLIRVETLEILGMPWDGKEQCFSNICCRLKALCEVRRGETVYARKLTREQSRRLLVQQCFLPMWDPETAVLQMKNIFTLASRMNCVRIFGGIEPEDAKGLWDIIQREQYMKEEPEMKAKKGFILRKVVNEYLLMPTDENIGIYRGAVLLNSVSAFIWEKMQAPVSRDDLLTAVLNEFDVDENKAANDLDAFLEKMNQLGIMENE